MKSDGSIFESSLVPEDEEYGTDEPQQVGWNGNPRVDELEFLQCTAPLFGFHDDAKSLDGGPVIEHMVALEST